jgi:hypothetical protein
MKMLLENQLKMNVLVVIIYIVLSRFEVCLPHSNDPLPPRVKTAALLSVVIIALLQNMPNNMINKMKPVKFMTKTASNWACY